MIIRRSLLTLLLALLIAGCSPFSATPAAPAASPPVAPPIATPAAAAPSPITIGDAATPRPPAPTTASDAIATPAPANGELIAQLDANTRPLRDQVMLARALGSCRPTPDACPTVARTTPLEVNAGDVRPFFVTDLANNTNFEITAELQYAGPVVLMYVEQGLPFSQSALERVARSFEQEIYPRTREVFGSELQPGVDGDPRITILNARDPSSRVLGYYSSQDSLPSQINRYSNEREMFFMNIDLMPFESPTYLEVLAHEFQHMIHQHQQPGSAIWFNEGTSQLASDLNGYVQDGLPLIYLTDTDLQLTGWSSDPGRSGGHYGAAHLFTRYIYAQYAGEEQIRPLIQANAGKNLDAFVELAAPTRPDLNDFGQIVADWAVANLLDDPSIGDGRYTYATGHELPSLLPQRARPARIARGATPGTLAQFGAAYLELPAGATTLNFEGGASVPLVGAPPRGHHSWWSFYGDDSVATLTRAFDLRELQTATLRFAAWYEIEIDYDYAFVTVSTDGGQTWETLPGSLTSDYDPQGVNYGFGITGISGHPGSDLHDGPRGLWVEEQMDLSAYAGQEILLRFWQINDQALEGAGIMLDDISIAELGFTDDAESDDAGWQAEGFVRVPGELPQRWELRLVRTAPGGQVSVEALPVNPDGAASAALGPGEQAVLVVVPTTPHTGERASYRLTVE
jgi:immune inhibitor A